MDVFDLRLGVDKINDRSLIILENGNGIELDTEMLRSFPQDSGSATGPEGRS